MVTQPQAAIREVRMVRQLCVCVCVCVHTSSSGKRESKYTECMSACNQKCERYMHGWKFKTDGRNSKFYSKSLPWLYICTTYVFTTLCQCIACFMESCKITYLKKKKSRKNKNKKQYYDAVTHLSTVTTTQENVYLNSAVHEAIIKFCHSKAGESTLSIQSGTQDTRQSYLQLLSDLQHTN